MLDVRVGAVVSTVIATELVVVWMPSLLLIDRVSELVELCVGV